MGWFQNLEDELQANRAGSSGQSPISNVVIQSIELTAITQISIPTQNAGTDGTARNSLFQHANPFEVFFNNVKITGLPEAYGDKSRLVRIMFRLALIAACFIITYETVQIIRNLQEDEKVYTDLEWLDTTAPFPNVSACFPLALNVESANRLLDGMRPHVDRVLRTYNVSMDQVWSFLAKMVTLRLSPADKHTRIHFATKKIFDRAFQLAAERGKHAFREMLQLPCSELMDKCKFNGIPFDCCQYAEFAMLVKTNCYHLGMNWLPNHILRAKDSMRLDETGLSFDLHFDITRAMYDEDGSVSSGFHMFIGFPSDVGVPVPVPSGADILIALDEPKRMEEISHCRPEEARLQYVRHEDPEGHNCKFDLTISAMTKHLGCTLPLSTYSPAETGCNFDISFYLSTATANGGIEFDTSHFRWQATKTNENSDPLSILSSDKTANSTFSCWPICSRWSYREFSTSYGFIRYRNQSRKDEASRPDYSRVRILMPLSSRVHIEERKPSAEYFAMCDIRNIMGVYIGLSMITFAQILGYGANIVWCKCRNRFH